MTHGSDEGLKVCGEVARTAEANSFSRTNHNHMDMKEVHSTKTQKKIDKSSPKKIPLAR